VKATRTKFETTLTSDDFDFIVAALNDASLEIAEKQEAKQEEVFSRIKDELQGVQQALQSSRAVSTVPLSAGTTELGDEPAQLHRIADTVEARLRRAQEETTQATQALAQVQKTLRRNAVLQNGKILLCKRSGMKKKHSYNKARNSCSPSNSK
jgi:hypothetical protein